MWCCRLVDCLGTGNSGVVLQVGGLSGTGNSGVVLQVGGVSGDW